MTINEEIMNEGKEKKILKERKENLQNKGSMKIPGENVKTLISSLSTMSSLTNLSTTEKNYYLLNYFWCEDHEKKECHGEYINEIFENLINDEKQIKIRPKSDFMKNQKEINSKMREILVDWIIDIHYKFKLNIRTLYLTVYIIDAYLSYTEIQRAKFQLLGIAALYLGAKIEDIQPPSLDNLIYVTDYAYTKDELLKMEQNILSLLDYNLVFPLSYDFYPIFAKLLNFNEEEYFLGQYFLEYFLLNYQSSLISGSVIAITCAYIVTKITNKDDYEILYDKNLNSKRFSKKEIKDFAKDICLFISATQNSNPSIISKYSQDKFKCVAKFLH